ncbi:MAG: ATP-binding protein [Bacteroidota bacterium]
MKKVVITGPECTGKTFLAKALADHYNTSWVPEFARDFLNNLDRPYVEEDLLKIAKGQLDLESQFEKKGEPILFYDTSLIVIKVWQQYKFGRCYPELVTQMNHGEYDLHLLMKPDIPWVHDCQRENQEDRDELFEIYKDELDQNKLTYISIYGDLETRIKRAIDAVDSIFRSH